ncbi:MAG: 3-oxoacyl-[acyl-carrier-protein] reductase [Chloroflexota bacterium]
MEFEGKVAVITGGRRGIGRAISEYFGQRGAAVVVADRTTDDTQQAAEDLIATCGCRALAYTADVASLQSAQGLIDFTLKELGRVDILVNNAGVTRDQLIMRMDEADWDVVLDVNLKGAWNCCKAVVRPMMKQRAGRIINISSVSGLSGQAGQTNYSASKAGLIGLTKALAREVASRNITVNAVAPGFVPTALTVDLPQELKDGMMKMIPLGRWGKPEEIAAAVGFFASDAAGYITGQVLSVDGGMVMM